MIRGAISVAGLAAEFGVYQSNGCLAAFLGATALVAAAAELLCGSPMQGLADRLIGGCLPDSVAHSPPAEEIEAVGNA